MTIKAIAWDIDGTLVDSEPLHYRALLAGSAVVGADLSHVTEAEFRGVHMRDVWQSIRKFVPASVSFEIWLDRIQDFYIEHSQQLIAIPGAVETIRTMAAQGVKQVCVSNSNRRIVDANVHALGIAPIVQFSLSLDDVKKGKPDPEPYLTAAHMLGLAPQEMLVVEDSLTGATSGLLAGMVTFGYHLQSSAGVELDYSFEHYDQFCTAFQQFNSKSTLPHTA